MPIYNTPKDGKPLSKEQIEILRQERVEVATSNGDELRKKYQQENEERDRLVDEIFARFPKTQQSATKNDDDSLDGFFTNPNQEDVGLEPELKKNLKVAEKNKITNQEATSLEGNKIRNSFKTK